MRAMPWPVRVDHWMGYTGQAIIMPTNPSRERPLEASCPWEEIVGSVEPVEPVSE
jgi:hypothetical protein